MMRFQHKQQGVSLLAMAIVIGVLAVMSIGLVRKQMTVAQERAGASFGYVVNEVSRAVDNYRGTNFNALTNATPVVDGFANPMAPTVAELKAAGYLHDAVVLPLPDGNMFNIKIDKMPAGCIGPTPGCNAYSVIWLSNPILDVDTGKPSIDRLSGLVGAVEEPVSYATEPDPSKITGGAGAWTIDNPDPAKRAGIVLIVAGLGGTHTQWLRPGDPRDPQFQSNTTTSGYLKPSAGIGENRQAGESCADEPEGAIRNDDDGRVLSCQHGIWTAGDGAKSIILRGPIPGVVGGTVFPLDACPPNGKPWATYVAEVAATKVTVLPPYEVLTFAVNLSGSQWTTSTQAAKPPAAPVKVNGDVSVLGVVPTGTFTAGCNF